MRYIKIYKTFGETTIWTLKERFHLVQEPWCRPIHWGCWKTSVLLHRKRNRCLQDKYFCARRRQMMFECASKSGATFALFDENNKHVNHSVMANITGGPSICFLRDTPKHSKLSSEIQNHVRGWWALMLLSFMHGHYLNLWPLFLSFTEDKIISKQKWETNRWKCIITWTFCPRLLVSTFNTD